VIVESFVTNYLLEECDKLACIILIWLWKIDVFKVNDQSGTVSRSVYFAMRACGLSAHLVKFLYNLEG
jgi:hypothetical protein